MDWNTSTLWWLATGALVAAELATGTFYLLMLALGCTAGAVVAHLGFGVPAQILVAALIGISATGGWYLKRSQKPVTGPAAANRDVTLDIGESVQVDKWSADGSARVRYRGAAWSARYAGSGEPMPGEHTIVAMHGSELQVVAAAAR